jgi:hypothetical protein
VSGAAKSPRKAGFRPRSPSVRNDLSLPKNTIKQSLCRPTQAIPLCGGGGAGGGEQDRACIGSLRMPGAPLGWASGPDGSPVELGGFVMIGGGRRGCLSLRDPAMKWPGHPRDETPWSVGHTVFSGVSPKAAPTPATRACAPARRSRMAGGSLPYDGINRWSGRVPVTPPTCRRVGPSLLCRPRNRRTGLALRRARFPLSVLAAC